MKVAVIGTGISGLVTAHLLALDHDLVVYEAQDHIGGHTHTHDVEHGGRGFAIDTGFIVFNDRNYPAFTRLLEKLGVASKPTSMSFSVQCERTGLEYNGTSWNTLFAQRRNALRPAFLGMLRDILRFNREAQVLLADDAPDVTLGEFLERGGYGNEFVEHYVIPMGAAIWSTPAGRMREFPALFFVRFFHNHGMLTVDDRPTWRVVRGGSRNYVQPLLRRFWDRVRTSCPVRSIRRFGDRVEVQSDAGTETFDQVVLATHSDQALALLDDPSERERAILGAIEYQLNEAILHTDASLLPATRRAWASWNYFVPRTGQAQVTLTYSMNILQGLEAPEQFCVTLNRRAAVDSTRILEVLRYHHPVYTVESVAARARWAEISGTQRTHFCGAYWGSGFHEDGVQSALAVARCFGKDLES